MPAPMPARTCTSTGTEQNCQIRPPRYQDVGTALASSKLHDVYLLVELSYRDNLCAGHLQNLMIGRDRCFARISTKISTVTGQHRIYHSEGELLHVSKADVGLNAEIPCIRSRKENSRSDCP